MSAVQEPSTGLSFFPEFLPPSPLQWGPFRAIPHLDYRFSYSTGLPYGGAAGLSSDTASHSVSPGLSVVSKHLTFDYTPTLTYYTKGRYEDSLNHRASLSSAFGYGDWRFALSHAYASASQVLVETASQTDTESHSTSLSAAYRLTEKTSIDLSASQAINDTSGFNSSKTWSTMNWIDHQVTDITSLGVGAGGGYTDVELGSDMTYEQIQARVNWAPRPKISAALNGGIEIRQFLARTGAEDQVNPIMGASASYRPFDYTTLSLSANRGVGTSLFSDQITETTSVTASLGQRFLERLQASLSGGVRMVDYQSSLAGLAVDRSDTVKFFSASLGSSILKRGSASLSYSLSSNDSSVGGFSYTSHTISAGFGYSF